MRDPWSSSSNIEQIWTTFYICGRSYASGCVNRPLTFNLDTFFVWIWDTSLVHTWKSGINILYNLLVNNNTSATAYHWPYTSSPSSTLIDFLIKNDQNGIIQSGVINVHRSNHDLIFCELFLECKIDPI